MTGLRVIVVEDEALVALAAACAFEEAGWEAVTAHDGLSGLALFRERGADLVLADVGLPRLSGPAMVARMREADPALPVLVFSAWADRALGLADDGRTAFLSKPANFRDLVAAATRLMAACAAQPAR